MAGIVKERLVEMGDVVKGDQILIKLDDTEAKLRLEQSKVDLQVAEGLVEQARITRNTAKENHERNQLLRTKQVISQSDLQKSDQDFKKAEVSLMIAKAKKEQSMINHKRASINFENCIIRAPWKGRSGWVSRIQVNEGDLLNNNGGVLTISDLDTIVAIGHVTEKDYSRLKVGQQGSLKVQSFETKVFSGNISSISPSFDSRSRMASFEMEVKNTTGELRPGMMASMKIDTGFRKDITLVPVESTIYHRGQQGVFLYDEESTKATFKKVQLGEIRDGYAEVVTPKKLNGQVVTLGNHMLRSGRPVRIQRPEEQKTPKVAQKNKKAKKKAQP